MSTALRRRLDPRGGSDTAWLIVREQGSGWPRWLTERLRRVPLVIVIVRLPGQSHDRIRDRVAARAAELELSKHHVTGVLLCSGSTSFADRQALANVVIEQVASGRGGRLLLLPPPN